MENESCEFNSRPKQALVVSCYQWDWQEVLTIEAALDLKSRGYQVMYLDLSSFSEKTLRGALKFLLGKQSKLQKKKKILRRHSIEVVSPKIIQFSYKILYLGFSVIGYFPGKKFQDLWEIAYPGLVDLTGDIHIGSKSKNKLVKKSLISVFMFEKILNRFTFSKGSYDSVVIVNGRFPLNRAASQFFRKHQCKVVFIEFGANRNKFQFYSRSPHSMANRLDLFREFRNELIAPPDEIEKTGAQFFVNRRVFDSQANLSWTRKMNVKNIPDLGKSPVCTFFPTSEKEFIGVRDLPKEGEFLNQFDALEALINNLGTKWKIYIRRHPKAQDSHLDPEAELWELFEGIENVTVIPPDSEIDSYELGMKSDLVAHYSSFIGPELIFAGHKSVITLGHTLWEDLDPERHLFGKASLLTYLRNPHHHVADVDIELLGFYMATFGQNFSLCEWNQNNLSWSFKEEFLH